MIDGYLPMRLLLKDKLKNDSNNLATFDKPQTFIHESDNDHTCWNNNTGTTPASKKTRGVFKILSFSSIYFYQKAGGNTKMYAPSTVNKWCRQFVFFNVIRVTQPTLVLTRSFRSSGGWTKSIACIRYPFTNSLNLFSNYFNCTAFFTTASLLKGYSDVMSEWFAVKGENAIQRFSRVRQWYITLH